MSSRTDLQSMVMLGTVVGCFNELYSKRYFARVDIHKMCFEALNIGLKMTTDWPIDGNNFANYDKAVSIVRQWDIEMLGQSENLPAASLVYIASRLINDLKDKVKNQYKKNILSRLDDHIKILENFTDPEGGNFPAYEKGDYLLDILYNLIEWEN